MDINQLKSRDEKVLEAIQNDLQSLADPSKIPILSSFFKTKIGEYGYGDKFIGLTVPNNRLVAKKYYKQINLEVIQNLLISHIHEFRLYALISLVYKFKLALIENDTQLQKQIFQFYLANTLYINNWDLVDCSCRDIIGAYLLDKDRHVLYNLSKSANLWERRISIVSTFYFISRGQFDDTLDLSKFLIIDEHDLIHKACGWMLREVGKKDLQVLKVFLNENYKLMPRVMLRYSIERLDKSDKDFYMKLNNK